MVALKDDYESPLDDVNVMVTALVLVIVLILFAVGFTTHGQYSLQKIGSSYSGNVHVSSLRQNSHARASVLCLPVFAGVVPAMPFLSFPAPLQQCMM